MRHLAAVVVTLTLGLGTAQAATVVVTQKNHAFVPSKIEIATGDTILFRNEDTVPHQVVSHTPIFQFDLDLERPGEERSQVFTQPGMIVVGCDLHSNMEVIVTVTPGPAGK
ncbi:cupredoxin domain-containing protein [Nitrospirillum sp. BR 11752]|uniref:cupredoxin domain-containing protein n=1 Tax=Nitrospirillum sp. BR 11752 TaxID=3104293 RepID=UPI002EAFFCCD|nr:cupredoxin domain-containing protein [Nitrospirillum sp. BR 11752]